MLEVAFLLLLLDLALEVPLTVTHFLHCALLCFYVALSLLPALHPGLEFKILFLKATKLGHQLILLLNELLEAMTQLRRLRFSYRQLGL